MLIPCPTGAARYGSRVVQRYDGTLVSAELLPARVNINQPSEVALYVQAFEELPHLAVYGTEARALIVRAIDVPRS